MKIFYRTKIYRSQLLAFFMVFLSLQSFSQDKKVEKGNDAFESKSYIEAAEIYEKVAEKGYRSESLLQNLADSYYFNGKYDSSTKWYKELFALNASQSAEYTLRYAQSLKATGAILEGEKYYDEYLSKGNSNVSSNISAAQYLDLISENSGRYTIKKVPFNTEGVDFGVSFLNPSKLVYASTRDAGVLRDRLSAWDGLPYLDLYEVEVTNDTVYSAPKALKGSVNQKYHESTASFTKDGKTMYFTRTNPKKSENGEDLLHLKIYRSVLEGGKWVAEEDLSINGADFNTAHPVLNLKEDKLYFASDRSGGQGQTDLYYVSLNSDGSLGNVTNLGDTVNTAGRESFPFISEDGALYFSSDGHFGLGGYDVFYLKLKNEKDFTGNLLNVGKPINSSFDDVSYVIKNTKGYISSNRSEEGSVYDDIYRFVENTPIKEVYLKSVLHGIVSDKTTGLPLGKAVVEVLDAENNLVDRIETDKAGAYRITVAYNPVYLLKVTKADYSSADAFSEAFQEDRAHDFALVPKKKEITPGTDLSDVLNIPIIYFDLDKSFIRSDAAVELQKIVEAMNMYPELKIDIRSHTDSRASDAYNMSLSDRRAKSTMSYLIKEGVAKDRLTAQGYGESQLVNKCSNGVPCTNDEHQANRRSEFIIVK